MQTLSFPSFSLGENYPLVFILGPCVIEGEKEVLSSCEFLKKLTEELKVPFIFKASYDKANRSSLQSYRGPGIEKGLAILKKAKQEFQLPILTDVHNVEEAKKAAEVCDILQIPAFLCRQTDLVVACAQTGRVVNLKKGQFLAPWDVEQILHKITSQGNDQILVTERGSSFGYNNLVADMRNIPLMQAFGYPVCFDATHSVQLPGKEKHISGGDRFLAPALAKAAVAAGCNALFLETHPHPDQALSDKYTQIPFSELRSLLHKCAKLHQVCVETC